MRRFKNNLSILLVTVILAVALCSCTAKSAEKDTQPAPEAAAEAQASAESQDASAETQEAVAETQDAAAQAEVSAAEAQANVAEADATADAGAGTAEAQATAGPEANTESGIMPVYTLKQYSDLTVDGDVLLASGSYETVKLTEEAKAAYPALNETLEALGAKMTENAESQYNEIKEAAESYRVDYQGDLADFPSGEMTIAIEPVRCGGGVLSFIESCALVYPDAAHGFSGYTGYNYDTATGAAITLEDVVTDLSALLPAVAENLVSLSDGMPVEDVQSELEQAFDEDGKNLSWVLDRDALVLRFAPYDVAPYARGTIEARVPFAKYPGLFTGKYGLYDGAFAKKLNPYMPISVDLNGDGETETVYVTGTYGMDDLIALSYSELEVTVGTAGCAEQADFYSWDSVVLHTADGRNILLVETMTDSDFTDILVFKADSSGPSLIGKMEGMRFAKKYHEAEDYVENYAVLDPSRFALKEWTDEEESEVLFYEIGEDGMPSQLAE